MRMVTHEDGGRASAQPFEDASPAPAPALDHPLPAAGQPDSVAQLRFLHELLRLATTVRTWEELLEAVVDGTRDALHANVSSLYLLDRDGSALTLAATNGLDRHHIGRVAVPYGEGITGRVAATRTPIAVLSSRRTRASSGCGGWTSVGTSRPCCRFP
jgi:transcriptional regulator with GAF, ATPase, and Fis domain